MLDATSGRDTSGSFRALQRLIQDGASPVPFPSNHFPMTSFKHFFTSLEQLTSIDLTSSCGNPNTSPRSSHSETIPFSARRTLRLAKEMGLKHTYSHDTIIIIVTKLFRPQGLRTLCMNVSNVCHLNTFILYLTCRYCLHVVINNNFSLAR